MPSYGKVAKLGVIWSGLGRIGYEAISVPTAMILARLVSPEDFGIAAAVGFFIQLAMRLTNLGLNTALVQVTELREAHRSTVFWFNFLLCAAAWAVLTVAAPWLAGWFRAESLREVLPVAALSFVLGACGAVQEAQIMRDLRFRAKAAIDTSAAVVLSAVSVAMAWFGYGVWSLIYGQLSGIAASVVLRTIATRWVPRPMFSLSVIREFFSYGVGLQAKRLFDSAALNLDNLIIARMLGMAPLGFYDKAFSTMNRALTLLTTGGPSVSFRVFAIIRDDPQRFQAGVRKAMMAATLVGFPVLAWMAASGPQLFMVLFGEDWVSAVPPFQILCVSAMFRLTINYCSTAIQAKGVVWSEVARQVVFLALLVAGVTLGSLWGITGAAIGVAVASAVQAVLMQRLLRRIGGVHGRDLWVAHLPAMLCSTVVAAAALAVAGIAARFVPGVPALAVLAVQAVAAAALALGFVTGGPFPEVRALFDDTLKEFAPRLARRLHPATGGDKSA